MKELKNKLLKVQDRLKNGLTKKIILDYLKDYMEYDYDEVERSIKSYLNHLDIIYEATNEEAYETTTRLIKHLNHFIENTKDKTHINLYHMELLDDINFFIENSFEDRDDEDNKKIVDKNSFKEATDMPTFNKIKEILKYVEEKPKIQEHIRIKKNFSDKKIEYKFNYKNILLKGVPGTGKSRTIDHIINNHLNLKEEYQETNVLRINIHSASSNADLMQGIAINSNDGNIEYKEKQGLVLEFIEKATFNPNQPFVLVLEEIQENSLNELIGDLIYLIEDSKRAKGYKADNKPYIYSELIDIIIKQNSAIHSVKLPSLISKVDKVKRMIIPHNLFIFCTSNYRDDRKVIEDNLLRRFEVIEIYPKYKDTIGDAFKSDEVSNFLKDLNTSIVSVCSDNGEIHPDRFMIGHSIWLNVTEKKSFSRAFLKVITEFKDIKDMHFDDVKKIVKDLDFPFGVEKEYDSYEEWINVLQNECYDFLKLK